MRFRLLAACLPLLISGTQPKSVLGQTGLPEQLHMVRSYTYPGGNLLSNGNFENNYTADQFEGWYQGFNQNPAIISPIDALNDVASYEGRRHIAVHYQCPTKASGENRFRLLSDFFPFTPNTTYTLFLRYRAIGTKIPTGASICASVHFWKARAFEYNKESKAFDFHTDVDNSSFEVGPTAFGPPYVESASWTMQTFTFTTPSGANFGNVFLLVGLADHPEVADDAEGSFFFDNVSIVEGDVSVNDPGNLKLPENVGVSTKFLNGNNKVIQSTVRDGSRDIVKQTFYDEMGRVSRTTLPIARDFGSLAHNYIPGITANDDEDDVLSKFYHIKLNDPYDCTYPSDEQLPGDSKALCYPEANGKAYSELRYEPSPLGRVIESAGPGSNWAIGAGHTVTTSYSSILDLSVSSEGTNLPAPRYEDGRFYVKVTKGTDGQVTREFKDKMGRLVRKTQKLGEKWVETNYTYDANGNLILVKSPPPASPNGLQLTQTMEYDAMNQVISESTPATRLTQYIYDDGGRLRFTQSANQASTNAEYGNRFSYTKYDEFGRAIQTGEVLDATLFTQGNANIEEFPCTSNCQYSGQIVGSNLVKIRVLNHYDDASLGINCDGLPDIGGSNPIPDSPGSGVSQAGTSGSITFMALNPDETVIAAGYDIYTVYQSAVTLENGLSEVIRIIALYQGDGIRDISPLGAKLITRVDDLRFVLETYSVESTEGIAAMQKFVDFRASHNVFVQWDDSYLFGRLVKTTSCNYELANALSEAAPREVSKEFRYDKYGNVIRVVEINQYADAPEKRVQVSFNSYDLQNRAIEKSVCADLSIDPVCNGPTTHVEKYKYDNMGRVSTVTGKTGSIIIDTHYNFLGQATNVSLGGKNTPTSGDAINLKNQYHLNGWTKQITAAKNSDQSLLFSESLDYETGTIARYDGNVAGVDFAYAGSPGGIGEESYNYSYDDLGRLTISSGFNDAYDYSSVMDYFDDGRISSLGQGTRGGTYGYDSRGRIYSIEGDLVADRDMDPQSLGKSVFGYDESGNLITDNSKAKDNQPLQIRYRSDNLPYEFKYKELNQEGTEYDTWRVLMTYNEGGGRVSKTTLKNGSWNSTKSYFSSGKEIREFDADDSREFFNLASVGRVRYDVENPNGDMEFYIKDHLGSLREVYDLDNASIFYATHYYPYGKQFGSTQSIEHPITEQFTSKELDDGTNLTYFGARYYDQNIGLWTSPDPKRQHASPYSYGSSDPINRLDPNGGFDVRRVPAGMRPSWDDEGNETWTREYEYQIILNDPRSLANRKAMDWISGKFFNIFGEAVMLARKYLGKESVQIENALSTKTKALNVNTVEEAVFDQKLINKFGRETFERNFREGEINSVIDKTREIDPAAVKSNDAIREDLIPEEE